MNETGKLALSDKQSAFFFTKGKRLNFLSGSIRSGKTYISLWKWALWVASMPKTCEFIMVGKTITSLSRNCLGLLEFMVGTNNFTYSTTKKRGILFGRIIHLEGANDERSERKIRGMTLAGAYCDEITLFPESFTGMLLSRLSEFGAKLWATCNPDDPDHYIKKGYIDKGDVLDVATWHFVLEDNISLDPEYVKNISLEYTGVYHQRFILGRWVRAEGIIYEYFANNVDKFLISSVSELNKNLVLVNIGVDFGGNASATTFVCTGITQNFEEVAVLEAERIEKNIAPGDLDRMFVAFAKMCITNYGRIGYSFCDSAEQILIRGMKGAAAREHVPTIIQNARKSAINERIQLTIRLMSSGRLKIMRHCTTVIEAFKGAVWDAKAKTKDVRLDDGTSDIDTLDGFEYSIETYTRQLTDFILRKG